MIVATPPLEDIKGCSCFSVFGILAEQWERFCYRRDWNQQDERLVRKSQSLDCNSEFRLHHDCGVSTNISLTSLSVWPVGSLQCFHFAFWYQLSSRYQVLYTTFVYWIIISGEKRYNSTYLYLWYLLVWIKPVLISNVKMNCGHSGHAVVTESTFLLINALIHWYVFHLLYNLNNKKGVYYIGLYSSRFFVTCIVTKFDS